MAKYIEVVYGPVAIYKFLNLVKSFFQTKINIFSDIKIYGEKMINTKTGQSCLLTDLEKKILLGFVDKKKISRDYFLEKILNIKKNVETKTIESHLTRIRKKIKNIGGKINITSRSDFFFLDN